MPVIFTLKLVLLLILASALRMNPFLFGITIAGLIALIYYIRFIRTDLSEQFPLPSAQLRLIYILPLLAIFIRIFPQSALNRYTILFLPFAGELIFSFWDNYIKPKSINIIFAFISLAIGIFILTLFISPHITFPYFLTLFLTGFLLALQYYKLPVNTVWKPSLLYISTFILFPVLNMLLSHDLFTAVILSGCFAYFFYLHHFVDEIKGSLFFFIGILFFLTFQWSGFLAFILMASTCFYISFIAHEFKISFTDSDSFFYSLTTRLLSFEILPVLLALAVFLIKSEIFAFVFYSCQAFILFRLLIEILGRAYSRYGYSIPQGKKVPLSCASAISAEGLLLSLFITIIYVFLLSMYSPLIGGKTIVFLSVSGLLIYLVEKWSCNYTSFCSAVNQFLSLLLLSILAGFYLLF